MAPLRRVDIRDKDLHGLKYFRLVGPLLERLQSGAVSQLRYLRCFLAPLLA
jgi:hypothetical protein